MASSVYSLINEVNSKTERLQGSMERRQAATFLLSTVDSVTKVKNCFSSSTKGFCESEICRKSPRSKIRCPVSMAFCLDVIPHSGPLTSSQSTASDPRKHCL